MKTKTGFGTQSPIHREFPVGLVMLVLGFVCGCKAPEFGPYTAPRVTGTVVAADSGLPLPGVTVRRGEASRDPGKAKAGELLIQPMPARTDEEGRFEFPSQRALTVFRPHGWRTVKLTFERSGYERFSATYSVLHHGTNTHTGEPVINTGNVTLQPHKER